ncbi:hypothetical protein ISCGN_006596 [Ixodes scapularis]
MLPSLPAGYIATNAVFLHCDVKKRPYRIQDFRHELEKLDIMKEMASAGAYQMNHVWMLRLHSLAAKQKLANAKELAVKGKRCLVLDPASNEVKLKLHWVPYDVPNFKVQKELEKFGKVSSITRERFTEQGFENVESNTRLVQMTLHEGMTVDKIPHEVRLEGCRVLVLVPGRAPLCLRCRRTGHIRRECRVTQCTDCNSFGHATEECVTTYASIARDRKEQDESEMFMDATEAEEAVGTAAPEAPDDTPKRPDTGAGNDDGAEASHDGTSEFTKHRNENNDIREYPHAEKTAFKETSICTAIDGDQRQQFCPSTGQHEPMNETGPTRESQLDRPPVPDAPGEEEQSSTSWTTQGPKKARLLFKPRMPPDDRCNKNSHGVVEDDKVYQVYWAGDARTKGSFYDAKVLYMAVGLAECEGCYGNSCVGSNKADTFEVARPAGERVVSVRILGSTENRRPRFPGSGFDFLRQASPWRDPA